MRFFKKNKKSSRVKREYTVADYNRAALVSLEKSTNKDTLCDYVMAYGTLNDDKVIKLTCHIPRSTNLVSMDLSCNYITNIGAAKLATLNPAITELNLSHNSIDDEGARCFLSNPHLQKLDLSFNQLSWKMNFIVSMVFPLSSIKRPNHTENSLFKLSLLAVKRGVEAKKITQQELEDKLPLDIINDYEVKKWKIP